MRWAFHQFYNRFAFTYDAVSALVSRGEWRAWTHAALPYLHGPRLLELAFGPGGLHLSLWKEGWKPVGVDLSPYMIEITRAKFAAAGIAPRLARGRAEALPFASASFDQVVMTFPPGVPSRPVLEEIRRVLGPEGYLVWVDGGWLKPADGVSRLLDAALDFTSGASSREAAEVREEALTERLPAGVFRWEMKVVERARSTVYVILGKPP